MPASRSPAQQTASRTNGARSHGPATAAGKARSARNGTRHGLSGVPFALLPDEDREEFAELHAAVTSDWHPRDAYERRWVMELVTSMWRQYRLRGLKLAALAASAAESPPGEATVSKLLTFARYGARIDKDIGRALQALRVLRDRPDAWSDELQAGTSEPELAAPLEQNCTNELPPCTRKPEARLGNKPKDPAPANDDAPAPPAAAVPRPASRNEPKPDEVQPPIGTPEPERRLNRHRRRALAAIGRKRAA